MIRHVYSFALALGIPLILLRLYLRSLRAPAYRARIGERFARTLPAGRDPTRPLLWLHAVSVGETVAAAPLVNALLEQGTHQLLITTMTPTGSQRVRALFGDRVLHCYAPYDLPFIVGRFIEHFKPDLLVLMETELWPNLIHSCHARGIHILLANGRLSAKSVASYRRFARTTRNMLACLDRVAVQADADGERFVALGVSPERVLVSGSLKFNVKTLPPNPEPADVFRQIKASGRPVIIAASTREKEEVRVLEAFSRVNARHGDALLILVPRHPERFDEVARLCREHGFALQRRSEGKNLAQDSAILLGDSMGEMNSYYDCATLAFVGGSLVDTGCQNVLEPAAMGLPVLVGPSQYNFATICSALEEAGGLLTVADAAALGDTLNGLLDDRDRARQMGEAGRALVAASQQALPAHLALLAELLEPK